jgi:hypothetical protein
MKSTPSASAKQLELPLAMPEEERCIEESVDRSVPPSARARTHPVDHPIAVASLPGTRPNRRTVRGASATARRCARRCRHVTSGTWGCRSWRHDELCDRTAVVRDPYARWCGRRGAVRLLPSPIGAQAVRSGRQRQRRRHECRRNCISACPSD